MLKASRIVLGAGVIAIAITGCTYSEVPAEPGQTSAGPAPAATTASPSAITVVLEGTFQSQAFPTTGTATIRAADSGATLELKDFSTEDDGQLTVVFSPGTLSPNAEGEFGLTSDQLIVMADLKPGSGTQVYEFEARRWAAMPSAVKSVVIYNFPDRVAYGTANLTEMPPS
ncbi:DM13 domain-containing protein [Pseudarthrobacter oxydans]|uniref:DM13 domain-containing protein n=1 Tax=Pseudarthrobacter oxydans TaxID=1671 RepID=UPI003420711C